MKVAVGSFVWVATLEPVAWVLRLHRVRSGDVASWEAGTAYEAAATVTADDNRVATIRGLVAKKKFTPGMWRAVHAVFLAVDIRHALFTRKNNGKVRPFLRPVKPE